MIIFLEFKTTIEIIINITYTHIFLSSNIDFDFIINLPFYIIKLLKRSTLDNQKITYLLIIWRVLLAYLESINFLVFFKTALVPYYGHDNWWIFLSIFFIKLDNQSSIYVIITLVIIYVIVHDINEVYPSPSLSFLFYHANLPVRLLIHLLIFLGIQVISIPNLYE